MVTKAQAKKAPLFFCFMFIQYTVLRLANAAGRGYLSDSEQEWVYYIIQAIVIAGFLVFAAVGRTKAGRAAVTASLAVCAAGSGFIIFAPTESAAYLAVTGICVFCLGFFGGAVYLGMAKAAGRGERVGRRMGLGCGAALVLQYLIQLKWTVVPLICVFLAGSFVLLAYILFCEDGARGDAETEVRAGPDTPRPAAREIVFVCFITLAMFVFTTYYTGYIHSLQIASGYSEFNVYTWPRLLMAAGLVLFGFLGDLRKGRSLPLIALCVVTLALLNAVLTGSGDAYWLNMCLYYVAISAVVAYYNLTFWRLAARMKRPALWAPAGRIFDSLMVIISGALLFSKSPAPVALTADISALAVILVLMALNGNLNFSEREKQPEVGAPELSGGDIFEAIKEQNGLTAAELAVFRELVLTEDKQAAIADRLSVKVRTVQAHTTAIYRKTGVSTRSGLVQMYHDQRRERYS